MRMIIETLLVMASAAAFSSSPVMAQDAGSDKSWSQADQYYDPAEMDQARKDTQAAMGGQTTYFLMADRLETQMAHGNEVLLWDGQGWISGDVDKFWFKTEGEYAFAEDKFEEAEFQGLWSHAIGPYYDVQAGVRYDARPDDLVHAVIGVQGLAPQWFEIDAAAFLSDDGDLTARVEAENDLLLTQRLILQLRVEVGFSAQDIPEREIGAGVTSLEAGLRLRYEIKREFAPYIGVEWQKKFSETADRARASGGDPDRAVFVAGLRLWY